MRMDQDWLRAGIGSLLVGATILGLACRQCGGGGDHRHRRPGIGQSLAGLHWAQQGLLHRAGYRRSTWSMCSRARNSCSRSPPARSTSHVHRPGRSDPCHREGRADRTHPHRGAEAALFAPMAKPAIKSMKELKGKMLSVGGAKDITRIFVERMLAPHGVKPGEFDMTFAGATSARFSALQSGAVDAAILTAAVQLPRPVGGFQLTRQHGRLRRHAVLRHRR